MGTGAKKTGTIVLRVAVFILSVLFAAVVYVWIESFGGEFLIMARGRWILITFAAMLVLSSIYGIAVLFLKSTVNPGAPVRVAFAILNPVAGIILLVIFYYLFLWVIDAMSMPELLVLSLPFIGYGLLLIADGLILLTKLVKSKRVQDGIPGMMPVGAAFIFLFGAFAITLMLWNPVFTTGVEHTQLFSKGMQEGRGYRIPSILTFKDNAGRDIVMAFAESRADVMLDWGDIDLVMRRSTDGGKTWGPVVELADAGKRTAGNPCPVFDRDTRTLWLPYCIDNKQVWMMKSTDYGATFSKPVDLTKELDLGLTCEDSPLCTEYGTGPGVGLQLKNSRLIIPAFYFGPSRKKGAHVIYSDDHGATWLRGGNLGAGEEPQVFETADGMLNMNCRFKRCKPRQVGLSRDGGLTWFDKYGDNALIDAETKASVISYPGAAGKVLFSNPAYCARGNMTLRMSKDDGRTWPVAREIYNGPSCYSQICVLPDGTILLLFESGKYDYREELTLVKVDMAWMSGGR
jgi:sialidase-1